MLTTLTKLQRTTLVAIDVTTGLPLIITVPQTGVDEYVLTELGRFLVETGRTHAGNSM